MTRDELRDPVALLTVLRLTLALLIIIALSYAADWALRAENFPVQHVRFEGPFQRVSQQELERAVLDLVRGNFFLVDLDAVKQRVEALPWVHRATVRRRFPHDIAVVFSEQHLIARWGETAWVNAGGEVVHVRNAELADDLPRFDGPEGSAAQVLAAYDDFRIALAPLAMRLAGLALAARRSWRLELARGDGRPLTLVLDAEHARERLERFARAYPAALAGQAGAIRQADLRYTNGFAVEWRQAGAPARVADTTVLRNEG